MNDFEERCPINDRNQMGGMDFERLLAYRIPPRVSGSFFTAFHFPRVSTRCGSLAATGGVGLSGMSGAGHVTGRGSNGIDVGGGGAGAGRGAGAGGGLASPEFLLQLVKLLKRKEELVQQVRA